MITFTIYGDPVAKGRPKCTNRGGFVRMYTPGKTEKAEQDFKAQAVAFKPQMPLESALFIYAAFFRRIPKSMSKKRTAEAEAGIERPTTRPDTDNYLKLVEDAMNGIFYKDDAQIVLAVIEKRYSDRPRIEIKLGSIEEAQNSLEFGLMRMKE